MRVRHAAVAMILVAGCTSPTDSEMVGSWERPTYEYPGRYNYPETSTYYRDQWSLENRVRGMESNDLFFYCREGIDPGCAPRFGDPADNAILLRAINEIAPQCPSIAATLRRYLDAGRLGMWDERILRFDGILYGRVDIPRDRILVWSGMDAQTGDVHNLNRTLAHEAYHVMYPNLSESGVRSYASFCL